MAKSNCDNCYYSQKAGDARICGYIFMTNHRRPCEPGDACTVKVPRIVKRRKDNHGKT